MLHAKILRIYSSPLFCKKEKKTIFQVTSIVQSHGKAVHVQMSFDLNRLFVYGTDLGFELGNDIPAL
jgi:hypothetical protein